MSEMFRCPRCGESKGLWQGLHVSGWRELDASGKPTHRREVDWAWVDELEEGGCGECGWDGPLARMRVKLGIDGEPLPEIHPSQQEIAQGFGA